MQNLYPVYVQKIYNLGADTQDGSQDLHTIEFDELRPSNTNSGVITEGV